MERDSLSTFPHFLLFPPSLSISYIKNCLILLQKVKIRHFCRECHKKLNIRAMRKKFLVEFAARKLRKLWQPDQVCIQPPQERKYEGKCCKTLVWLNNLIRLHVLFISRALIKNWVVFIHQEYIYMYIDITKFSKTADIFPNQ